MNVILKNILICSIIYIISLLNVYFLIPALLFFAVYNELDKRNMKNIILRYGQRDLELLKDELSNVEKEKKKGIEENNVLKEHISEGIIIIDSEGNVTYKNDIVDLFLKLDKRNIDKLSKNEIVEVIRNSFYREISIKKEVQIHHNFLIVRTKFLKKGKKNLGLIVFLYDVTPMKMLYNSQENFISDSSHELKTPLTSIINVASILDREITDTNNGKLIDILIKESDRMKNILSDLFEVIKLESINEKINIKKINSKQFIDSILDELSVYKDENLTIDIKIEKTSFFADLKLMQRAVRNLIKNSIMYKDKKVNIKIYEIDNEVIIEVIDDGKGIDKKHIKKIFEKFYRVDESRNEALGGTGLGLSMVKRIIDLHNGTITVDSIVNKKTKVIVKIPSKGVKK